MNLRRKTARSLVASLSALGHAYGSLFAGLGRAVLFLLAALTAGAVIVIPLWLFASRAPAAFTLTGLATLAAGFCITALLRIRASIRRYGSQTAYLRRKIVPLAVTAALVLLLTAWAYWVAVLLAGGLTFPGLLAGLLWLLALGVTATASRTLRRRDGRLP